MKLRTATDADADTIWAMLEPVFRAGATYAVDRDISRDAALAHWTGGNHRVFVAEDESGAAVGTYYLCRNCGGGGSHVANAGFVTAHGAEGKGVARAMVAHALSQARAHGFRAMQFNFVAATNRRAIDLWLKYDFAIVGRLPKAFAHPTEGYVDAFVMFRSL
ncbi:MAG: GNAT family N-acetyltransferase [Rhodobacteraceae bacterium]|nr:GNAT family N-acetyltransferase [Paracoccaceae bacterium]